MNGEGRKSGEPGAETRTTGTLAMTATATTTARTAHASRRRGKHDQVSSNGEREEYRARGGAEGESADKSAGWSGEDSDGAATDEDATTVEGEGMDGEPQTATSGG